MYFINLKKFLKPFIKIELQLIYRNKCELVDKYVIKEMTFFTKIQIINHLDLPTEIKEVIKDYTFRRIRKFHTDDARYELLLTIPLTPFLN
jgi:hypothetical protein